MNRLFLGKLSTIYPEQYKDNFYAGGKQGNSWYGGLQVGDYVFPIYDSTISKLWRVTGFSDEPTSFNPDGRINFEVIKNYEPPISIGSAFVRYKYFKLNLIMLNKSSKSTAKEKIGFHEVICEEGCPSPDKIDFNELRNFYISVENPYKPVTFRDGDIRVLLDNKDSMKIIDIQIYKAGAFEKYDVLWKLYQERNIAGQLYSLKELLEYAKADSATKKEKYLIAVIDEVNEKGVFSAPNPIFLYDNVLVGRKRTSVSRPGSKPVKAPIDNEEDDDDLEIVDGLDNYEKYREFVGLLNFNPNLVLYGPPGTGKTYTAQRIIEAFEYNRIKKARTFEQIQEEGRATFVTFHQSFSYEEFVEGLRPVIKENNIEREDGADKLEYQVQQGILLSLANHSIRAQILDQKKLDHLSYLSEGSRIWKISLGERGKKEHIYKSCIEDNYIAIGWFHDQNIGDWDYNTIFNELSSQKSPGGPSPRNDANSVNNFVNELQKGDLVLVFESMTSIRAIGIVEGDYEWIEDIHQKYSHRRNVRWLKVFDEPFDIRRYNKGRKLSQVTLYELNNLTFNDIKEILQEGVQSSNSKEKTEVPYFLIIDEINRGNISKIFGELITLIEKDKRDRLKVRLPYSQKDFSLPSNIYLIGTMNTADRSIAVLDTALRRRFIFKEVEPTISVFKSENESVGDINMATLLETINKKITKELDRDHRIGHSYFMNIFRLADLKIIWYYQIIPLLMEYFYNDPKRIANIITDSFIDINTGQIKDLEIDSEFPAALIRVINS